MNLITAAAVYTGDDTTVSGLRTMRLAIAGTGKKPTPIPLFVLPSFAAGDTCAAGAFEPETTLLVNGRIYPHEDGKMYVVPTQPIQAVPTGTTINQVYLAGGVGFIGEQYREDAFNFGLMCQAPPQKTLGHTWQDSLGFRIESWRDDAERMKKFLFVGRQVAMGGTLKFECWTGKDNVTRHNYKIRVRASQYSFFGKNKKTEELEKKADEALKEIKLENPQFADSPHQQAISKATSKPKKAKEVDDGIPF